MRTLLISLSCLGAGLSACSKSTPVANHPLDTLRIDVGSEAPTLDPALVDDAAAGRIINDLFSGLVDFDQQNNWIPGMAENIELDKARTT